MFREAREQGLGATCSDGSYALKHLLEHLGYDTHMLINSEGAVGRDPAGRPISWPTASTHCSMAVQLDGHRLVVDPCAANVVRAPLPIDHERRHEIEGVDDAGWPYRYTTEPLGDGVHIELRNEGPEGEGQIYVLRDRHVSDAEFEAYMVDGYREHKLTRRLVLLTVDPATSVQHRYRRRTGLRRAARGSWTEVAPMHGQSLADHISHHTGLPLRTLEQAIDLLGLPAASPAENVDKQDPTHTGHGEAGT